VERALLTLEPIEQAVVTCRRSSQTEELTAHLTLKSPMQTASTAQIRELLAKVLPAYMIPTRIHFLSVLPLTENGKVDRAGLRENAPITPPYTEQISAIFKEVLRLQHVDVLEHFLDLGGNSLLAGQIVNRISDYFHMQLSIADVFANATILQLSALLARQCPSQPATH
jgi:Phosphopantetheine attachment site/AMP-binding enzyme C-terminal domain